MTNTHLDDMKTASESSDSTQTSSNSSQWSSPTCFSKPIWGYSFYEESTWEQNGLFWVIILLNARLDNSPVKHPPLLVRCLKRAKQALHCICDCCRHNASLLVYRAGTDTGPHHGNQGAGMCQNTQHRCPSSPVITPQPHTYIITLRIKDRLPPVAFKRCGEGHLAQSSFFWPS